MDMNLSKLQETVEDHSVLFLYFFALIAEEGFLISDAGRGWGQEEKGTTEGEMAGWHR